MRNLKYITSLDKDYRKFIYDYESGKEIDIEKMIQFIKKMGKGLSIAYEELNAENNPAT